jgi:hypothetical protein
VERGVVYGFNSRIFSTALDMISDFDTLQASYIEHPGQFTIDRQPGLTSGINNYFTLWNYFGGQKHLDN